MPWVRVLKTLEEIVGPRACFGERGGGGGGVGWNMKGFKKMGEKVSSNTYSRTVVQYRYQKCTTCFFLSGTGTNKCGIGTRLLLPLSSLMGTGTSECGTCTNLLLPCFSALVPVPILVVSVPLYKNFQNSLHFRFHCMLASCTASNPLQTDLCLLNCVLHSLDTFMLTLEPSLLHVIKSPKVRTKLETHSSTRV